MRAALVVLLASCAISCRKPTPEVRPDEPSKAPPRVQCSIPPGDTVAGAVEVPARCDLTIGGVLHVPAGASLDIGPGAKLSFAKGAGLVIEGGVLRARGTAAEPIVFTSAAPTRAPGDWSGLVFARRPYDKTPYFAKPDAGADSGVAPWGESVVEHVIVEFGGAQVDAKPPLTAGGLVVSTFTPGDTVALSHVQLRRNAGVALFVASPLGVKTLDSIRFEDEGSIASVHPELFPSLGKDFAGVVRLHGALTRSLVLPKRATPYVLEESLNVFASTDPVTLEIEKGAVVQLARRGRMSVRGSSATAKLVAHGVTFTSAEAKPAPGDWRGFELDGDAAADLDAITVEYAGADKRPVVQLPRDEKKVRVVGSTFRDNLGAAFESSTDCKPWEDPKLKNTSSGKPLCEEGLVFSKVAALGVLGALGPGSSLSSVFSDPSVFEGGLIGDVAGTSGGIGYGSGVGLGKGGGGAGDIALGSGAGKASSKVTESSITASGALPVDVVRKAVRGRIASLRSCHAGSAASGTITVTFTIDDKGAVASAKASGGTLSDASIRSCAVSVFQGTKFPEGGGTTSATATHSYE